MNQRLDFEVVNLRRGRNHSVNAIMPNRPRNTVSRMVGSFSAMKLVASNFLLRLMPGLSPALQCCACQLVDGKLVAQQLQKPDFLGGDLAV